MSSPHDDNIARGMALLDEQAPGWERRINLSRLDLGSMATCVVGQLFGCYPDGLAGLDDAGMYPRRYGFVVDFRLHPAVTYGGLTRAWKRQIRARLQETQP